MSIKPILFSTEMVRAIQRGDKTVTRRVAKITINKGEPVSHAVCNSVYYPTANKDGVCANFYDMYGFYRGAAKPPYQPGDILYVRETWAVHQCNDRLPPSIPCKKTENGRDCYIYRADGMSGKTPCGIYPSPHKWRPSIHMPKKAARIFLRVTGVLVERLQDVTPDDVRAEETKSGFGATLGAFETLWDRTIKPADRDKYGWCANPWVWVIEFERCEKPEVEH